MSKSQYGFEADFSKAKKANKDFQDKLIPTCNKFMEKRLDYLVKRSKANCPEDLKYAIKKGGVRKSKEKFDSSIVCQSPDAMRVHEAPYEKQPEDKDTIEGGQGKKFIERPMVYHLRKTNEEALKEQFKDCPIKIDLKPKTS